MKKLFIDIDDVICENRILSVINEVTGKCYKEEDFSNYYMQEILTDDLLPFFHKKLFRTDIYKNCVFKEDSINVIKRLSKLFNIYLLTSAYVSGADGKAGRLYKDKYNFIVKHFSFLGEKKLVITYDKSIINGDILIDDRIDNLTDNFKTKLLFTCYSNKNISNDALKQKNIIRVNSWKEIENLLNSKCFVE